MSFSRFELGFPRNRKIHRLSDAGFRLWTCAIDYAREQCTDGRIDRADLAAIPRGGTGSWPDMVISELVALGLWNETLTGWEIHDFLDWQDSSDQVSKKREAARERMKSARAVKSKGRASERADEVRSTDHISHFTDPDLDFSDSDPEQVQPETTREPEAEPVRPKNLAEALELQIEPRARFVEENKHMAQWVNPERWPEVVQVAQGLHDAMGMTGKARLAAYAGDSGVRRVVELLAAGFTVKELLRAVQGIVKRQFWVSEGGRAKSLGALTVEVVRRELSEAPPTAGPDKPKLSREAQDKLDRMDSAAALAREHAEPKAAPVIRRPRSPEIAMSPTMAADLLKKLPGKL